MSTFATQTRVELDEQWVEDLLVTAFDRQYGGCNYWLNEFAHAEASSGERLLYVYVLTGPSEKWRAVTLHFEHTKAPLPIFNGGRVQVHLGDPGDGTVTRTVTLEGEHLAAAWAEIVDTRPIRADLVEQMLRSQQSGDLDVDADAADCLVQYALFGQVVYA